MKVCALIALGLAAVMGTSLASPQNSANAVAHDAVTKIEIERGGCLPACRAYKLSIAPDGTVTFVGEKAVAHIGTASAKVAPEAFDSMIRALDYINFFALRDTYVNKSDGCFEQRTDQAFVKVSVHTESGSKSVDVYFGCTGVPATRDVDWLARTIDFLAGSKKWLQ